jgi:hypothetical protein
MACGSDAIVGFSAFKTKRNKKLEETILVSKVGFWHHLDGLGSREPNGAKLLAKAIIQTSSRGAIGFILSGYVYH